MVVFGEVSGVEGAAEIVVNEVLPADGEAKYVHVVVADEMCDLTDAVGAAEGGERRSDGGEGLAAVCETAEVEAGDVYSSYKSGRFVECSPS